MYNHHLIVGVVFCFGGIAVKKIDSYIICHDPEIVSRQQWHARSPKLIENLTNPVPFVVIHHSYTPAACYTKDECIKAMQWMQNYHQLTHGWNDIGYNFAAGSDNRIYMGRGWSAVGAHAPKYNDKSIGIVLIGDWRDQRPPEGQITVVKQLIKMGVKLGYIDDNYKLVGHRQVRDTECPGTALYNDLQTWSHWTSDLSLIKIASSKNDEQQQIDAIKEVMEKPVSVVGDDNGDSLLIVDDLSSNVEDNNKSKRHNLAT